MDRKQITKPFTVSGKELQLGTSHQCDCRTQEAPGIFYKLLLVDTTFPYHKLPCSLQGPLYIISPRPACACVTHPPSLPVLVSHPLLHFLPRLLTATLFLQHHLSRTASPVLFLIKSFPGSKCRILAGLKTKNQVKDKKK